VHFCDKKDRSALGENPTVRSEALHVFGVDFFGEKEILEYFSEGNPSKLSGSMTLAATLSSQAQKQFRQFYSVRVPRSKARTTNWIGEKVLI
jgi:hypothetical protein